MRATLDWRLGTGEAYRPAAERTGTAHLRHYSARYSIWGRGRPLVLVPALAGGVELVGPLARELARDFQVISYQLRGEDDCFALRRRFDLGDLTEDLAELIDRLNLERPALMGVSFGGVVALELALRQPGRVESLILQGVGPHFEPNLMRQAAGLVLSRYALPPNSAFVNQFFNLFFGGKQRPGPLFDFVTSQCWRTDQSVMAHRFQMAEQANFADRLGGLRVPTMLMAGDRDVLVSPTGLTKMEQELPNGEAVRLAGCGHLAFVTHPERVAAEVRRFLDVE